MKKFAALIVMTALGLATTSFAKSASVAFYSGTNCAADTLLATLSTDQTAATCHQYATEHQLENITVLSLNEFGGCVTPMFAKDFGTFEAACENASK